MHTHVFVAALVPTRWCEENMTFWSALDNTKIYSNGGIKEL